jgi:hypothetical protein
MAKKRTKKSRLKETVRSNAAQTEVQAYSGDFNPDYSDIVQDLKRIGTLAAIFLAIMIALSFVIN